MSQNTTTYQLSIIIVNYNVEYFLDQCLDSVKKAIGKRKDIEVFIVDNASIDGSVKKVETKYPEFNLIKSTKNLGFSGGNNLAIRKASGKYILLLNPDTIVEESTFDKIINFMDKHPEAGGLGVRMVDGKGRFLPESKRGLPTPSVAFYKIIGLSKLFPKSTKFNRYHQGHLPETETNPVEILSGAFMLIRKSTLDKIGLLDETFFMYGEDIDLSYRILLNGQKNYYFADTKIIHYKGESTKKDSINYVLVFYKAMAIFAKKHFSKRNAKYFSLLIHLGIYLRALLAIISRGIKGLFLPLIDAVIICTTLFLLTELWNEKGVIFDPETLSISLPLYTSIWILLSYFYGAYDYPVKRFKFLKGIFWGTLLILLIYALLPKDFRFSRLFIFIGAISVLSYYLISRVILSLFLTQKFKLKINETKNFGIVGDKNEFKRIKEILTHTNISPNKIIHFNRLDKIQVHQINELIYASKNIRYTDIIDSIIQYRNINIDFKIAPENQNYLIGSNSIDTSGDLYILNINNLTEKENLRKKRLFDIVFSTFLILLYPFYLFKIKKTKGFLNELLFIIKGEKSLIGYKREEMLRDIRLPNIKTGLISPSDVAPVDDKEIKDKLNILYARDYSIRKDLSIILKYWNKKYF